MIESNVKIMKPIMGQLFKQSSNHKRTKTYDTYSINTEGCSNVVSTFWMPKNIEKDREHLVYTDLRKIKNPLMIII